eukprot:TRINITY_DN12_c0_g2_i1.p1 TRINITY_DN12_c0_g2~~TRINITY_DN12_c0_g2_i1.p1  ORF type:complete len:606 (+),score=177.02 TRINITY_DN12_c0_g2_i1:96-1913(+)
MWGFGGFGGGGGGWGSGGASSSSKGGKGGSKGGGKAFDKFASRNAQAMHKDAKNEREAGYFWEKRQRLGKNVPHPKTAAALTAEEKELFVQKHHGVVGIDFDKYDEITVEVSGGEAKDLEPISSFEELWTQFPALHNYLWENIERCKYTKPTPIQKYALPLALKGVDAMCCAQTGSGKTCAFLVPILSFIDPAQATGSVGVDPAAPATPKAVVMAPTRELCSQIHVEARKLSFGTPIRASEVYGGVDAKPQLLELALGSDIITCTPGRLSDFINRGVLSMSQVFYLVLDEADRMLDMGFEPQIREIVQQRDMPSPQDGRMTLMFSATFPKPIQKLAQQFMRNYTWIGVGRVGGAVDSVEQDFMWVDDRNKKQELVNILRANPQETTLVFVGMKKTASWLEMDLSRSGMRAAAIHGDLDQPAREKSLQQFKTGKCKVLVATDVAARGLDIPSVAHVINFDLPVSGIDDYVHRIGRTGRAGRRGRATSFYCTDGKNSNDNLLREILQLLADAGKPVPECLQRRAAQRGVRMPAAAKQTGQGFGGNDARGGDAIKSTVRGGKGGGGGGSWGKGGKGGKGGGKGDSWKRSAPSGYDDFAAMAAKFFKMW